MCEGVDHRAEVVTAFCEECVWARSVRTHFDVLFESGVRRHQLLEEVAGTFFGDLHLILIEYVLLQQCKLTDPPSSGSNKDNLTTNYILTLEWSDKTRVVLDEANRCLMEFRERVVGVRHKLVGHLDLRSRVSVLDFGSFSKDEELSFWGALQCFADAAHNEAIGLPFEIEAAMQDGDAGGLICSLVDAVDYQDMANQSSGFILSRSEKRRYENA